MANDKPEAGKVYSLYNLSKRGNWKDAEVKRASLTVGQVVSYWDQANPLQEAVVVEPEGAHGQKCVFLDDGHIGHVSSSFFHTGAGWSLVDRIMTIEEIHIAVDVALVAQATRKRDREEAEEAKKQERAALPDKYKHLEKTGKYAGRVLAARNIRIELKRAFPGVKFSVTSEAYSMGNSIDISWTDGPTTKQVEAISNKYESGNFDGMTDCYNYEGSPFKDVFGESKYIHESRQFSEKLFNKAVLKIADEYGIRDIPDWEEYQNGRCYGSPMSNDPFDHAGHWSWQSLINRTAGEIAL